MLKLEPANSIFNTDYGGILAVRGAAFFALQVWPVTTSGKPHFQHFKLFHIFPWCSEMKLSFHESSLAGTLQE